MASTQPSRTRRVFLDSSVLIAAAISPTGSARNLLTAGFAGTFHLFVSRIVLRESERNIRQKSPLALPAFQVFEQALQRNSVRPPIETVLAAADIVALKDAPIVAGALTADAQFLATFDRRHLLNHKALIHQRLGVIVATPGEILLTASPGD